MIRVLQYKINQKLDDAWFWVTHLTKFRTQACENPAISRIKMWTSTSMTCQWRFPFNFLLSFCFCQPCKLKLDFGNSVKFFFCIFSHLWCCNFPPLPLVNSTVVHTVVNWAFVFLEYLEHCLGEENQDFISTISEYWVKISFKKKVHYKNIKRFT